MVGEEDVASSGQTAGSSSERGSDLVIATSHALTAWGSLLTGVNTQAIGELGTIASEWQDFVRRRLKEDAVLLQRLTRSAGPDQVISAYTDFWRKAGEDYGKEFATMAKLVADMNGRMAVVAQSATEEASTMLLNRKAD
jgi:hypothetical protein